MREQGDGLLPMEHRHRKERRKFQVIKDDFYYSESSVIAKKSRFSIGEVVTSSYHQGRKEEEAIILDIRYSGKFESGIAILAESFFPVCEHCGGLKQVYNWVDEKYFSPIEKMTGTLWTYQGTNDRVKYARAF